MPRQIRRLGWVPDLPDQRDFLYSAPKAPPKGLPTKVDLRRKCPPVYDQGNIGSCTANAIAAAIQFEQMKQGLSQWTPSRLFIYYNEREMEGHVLIDSGAQIRDGIKSVAKLGACPETMWTYDDTAPPKEGQPCPTCKFAQKPPADCYAEALKSKVGAYSRVARNLTLMKSCLADGFPFVFGFTCYENLPFQTKTGDIPLPGPKDAVIGGHAVLAVGYDDKQHVFFLRNSWGTKWGKRGYGSIPYSYLLDGNLSDDFWTIRAL